MKKLVHNLSIGQGILMATLSIVMIVLLITSLIYYTTFSFSSDSLVESQSREINKQIVLNYENYINSVIETANYIQLTAVSLDLKEFWHDLQYIFQVNTDIKKDVVSIILYDLSGKVLISHNMQQLPGYTPVKDSWFRNALAERSIFHFSAPHRQISTRGQNEQVISVSRMVDYLDNGLKKKGIMLIELNFEVITNLADRINLGENGHILILGDDDSLIYTSDILQSGMSPSSYNLAIDHYFGSFKATIGYAQMFLSINTLTHTRWRIVTVNNINGIARAKSRMLLFLFIVFLASFLVTALVAIYISRRISRPLNELEKCMYRIENGDFFTRVEVSGQREIVLVAKSFNNMIHEIRTLMDKVVNEQREKRKSELIALQNQINPHFLYNTLDSIVWLAEKERTDDVITTVIALARFFRISISKGQNFIPVKDEISHIKNYLTIQKIRYVDKFTWSLEIEPALFEYKVMKLILQPLVENAIYHGMGDETGLISIRGYLKDDYMVFEVENSGYGITEERIAEIYKILKGTHSENSVGMRNVYLRLKLYYGDRADVVITSELDEMTNIKLYIPVVTQ